MSLQFFFMTLNFSVAREISYSVIFIVATEIYSLSLLLCLKISFCVFILNFCCDSSHLFRNSCRNRVHFNLMLCLSQHKNSFRDRVFLSFIADSECCVAKYNLPWSCHKLKCLAQHRKLCPRHFVLIRLIVLLFSVATKNFSVAIECSCPVKLTVDFV